MKAFLTATLFCAAAITPGCGGGERIGDAATPEAAIETPDEAEDAAPSDEAAAADETPAPEAEAAAEEPAIEDPAPE